MRAPAAIVGAALYLGVALWVLRAVLAAPATTLPYYAGLPTPQLTHLSRYDQQLAVARVAGDARRLLTAPSEVFEAEDCYPLAQSVALGDHMLGNALLGTLPAALGANPILVFNVVVLLAWWIAALAMYALAYHWTRSHVAAFVAGFLFAFHPVRLADPAHPSVQGNQWTPLALLFADRLVTGGRWRDALALGLFLGLQLLEGFYQVLQLALLGAVYGAYLLVRHRRVLPALAPKLLAVAAFALALVTVLAMPYAHLRAAWGILGGRGSFSLAVTDFAPGGGAYAGSVAFVLAALALLDRLRGPRHVPGAGYDPRLAYLAAAGVVIWFVVKEVRLPGLGVAVPSLSTLGMTVIPGLDAVRALPALRSGVYLVAAFLAAYGVLALVERRRPLVGTLIAAVAISAAYVEAAYPPLAERSFHVRVAVGGWPAAPPAELLALYARGDEGAVLDLPFDLQSIGRMRDMSTYVFLAGFHRRPTPACYNSYVVPLRTEVAALAERLPDPRAADGLFALGFRMLILHEDHEARPGTLATRLAPLLADPSRTSELGRTSATRAYRLTSPHAVATDLHALAIGAAPLEPADVSGSEATVEVAFTNGGQASYRHPAPIEPTRLVARFTGAAGEPAGEYVVTALLPLALAPGESTTRGIRLPLPERPGEYELTVAPADTPDLVLGRRRVRVA